MPCFPKLLLLLLPFLLLNCQPEGKAPEDSKEWMIISGELFDNYRKGSVLIATGDSLEIFEPEYTHSTVLSLATSGDTLYIGLDTFLHTKTANGWSFQRHDVENTIRAIALRATGTILSDSMLIGRTLLEQRSAPHREVYLSPTTIEQYADQQYFKVRCFGEGGH